MYKTILGACALFIVATPLADAIASPTKDITSQPKFKAAEAMFAGKPQESCEMLEKSYALATIQDTDVLYLRGQCLQALGRHAEAIPYYERILKINPEARAVRPHLAAAYQQAGQREQSRREMQEILRDNPPEELAANIRHALASESAPKPWFIEAEASLTHDSNISAGPDSAQVTVFGLPFTLNTASREQSSWGNILSLTGGYRFGVNNNLGIVAQGSYDETNYFENDTFDSQTVGLSVGPVYRVGNWNLNANATAGWRLLDGDTYTRTVGTNARASYAMTAQLLFNASAGLVKNDYRGSARDGHSQYLNAGVNYKISDMTMLYAGYFLGHDDTKDARYENLKHGPNAGVIVKPVRDVTARLNLSYNHADYDGKEAAFNNQAREDDVYSAHTKISYDIGQFVRVDNLAVNLNLGYIRADSNIKIYDYDRQTATLSISKSW